MKTLSVLVLIAAAVLVSSAQQPSVARTISVHVSADDQTRHRYTYVPFQVPPGTTKVAITYRYERADGRNVIDFGLLEPGPTQLGTAAFRGWSGGAASAVTVATDAASPGYWPGPVPSGEWHAVLGLYKVADAGVDITVTVETSSAPAATDVAAARRAPEPLRRGAAWYAGILHAHTVHSDGVLTPRALLEKAREERLDFLAITDHNNTVHQLDAPPSESVLLISGEEVTTPAGHFNVWGLGGERDFVEFRMPANDNSIAPLLSRLHRRDAVIGINHPVADCLACSWTQAVPDGVDTIEIANGSPDARTRAMLVWDTLLRSGRHLTGVDGSDWHRGPAPLGQPALRVQAEELSTAAILDGIRHGRVIVVSDARLPAPELRVSAGGNNAGVGDTLRVSNGSRIDATLDVPLDYGEARIEWLWNGELIAGATRPPFRLTRYAVTSGYLRAHILSEAGTLLAVTNPVYIAAP